MTDAGRTLVVRIVRVAAIAYFLLLVPLVSAALSQAEGVADILGPVHGAGFLVLLFLCVRGSARAAGAGGTPPWSS